jgi:hypothetical protein
MSPENPPKTGIYLPLISAVKALWWHSMQRISQASGASVVGLLR